MFLGGAKIINLLTSVDNLIIIYSKWYKYNLLFLLLMSSINIVLDFYFIEAYGLEGAAISTLISFFLYNLVKGIFIYIKLRIQPFSRSTIILLATLIGGVFIGTLLQQVTIMDIALLSLVVIGVITGLFYTALFYLLKVSAEFNDLIDKGLGMFRIK